MRIRTKTALLLLLLLLPALGQEQKSKPKPGEARVPPHELQHAIDDLNDYRQRCGLAPVSTMAAEATRGADLHSHYMVRNFNADTMWEENAHSENPKRPLYSAEGLRAAQAGQMVGGWMNASRADASLERLVSMLYHRIPLLSPTLTEVGIEAWRDNIWWCACVLRKTAPPAKPPPGSGSSSPRVICFPVGEDIRLGFFAEATPNPLPKHKNAFECGYAVSATFLGVRASRIESPEAFLYNLHPDGPKEVPPVPCYFSHDQEALKAGVISQCGYGNTVWLIPKRHLKPDTDYLVKVRAVLNLVGEGRKKWWKLWKFRTGNKLR